MGPLTIAEHYVGGYADGYALEISPPNGGSYILLNSPSVAGGAGITGSFEGAPRWTVYFGNGTDETGDNVGSDFQINAWDDTGTGFLGSPLIIDRATGVVTTSSDVITGGNLRCEGGILQTVALEAGANAHCWFYDSTGASKGILYWENTADQMILSHTDSGANISITADGTFHTTGPCNFYSGNLLLSYYGLTYRGMAYGSASFVGFGWSTVVSGLATVSVDNGGAVYSIANGSDERMKEGIAPSTFDCLSTVLKFPLKQFSWKSFSDPWKLAEARAAKDAPVIPVGMIAQQIHEIFPAGVRKGDDHADHLGKVWDLDRNALISLLIGAVQQLASRVEELEAAR